MRTASAAAASSTADGRRRSGPSPCRPTAPRRLRRRASRPANSPPATRAGRPTDRRSIFVSDRRRESYYFANDSDLYEVPRAGGEPVRLASIDGSIGAFALTADGRRIAFVGTLHGEPGALLQPARSLGRRSPGRDAAQPDRQLRLRRQRQRRRRPARAARPVAVRPGVEPGRAQHPDQGRRAGQRQSGPRRRGHRTGHAADEGQPGNRRLHRRHRRGAPRRGPLDRDGDRRSRSGRPRPPASRRS